MSNQRPLRKQFKHLVQICRQGVCPSLLMAFFWSFTIGPLTAQTIEPEDWENAPIFKDVESANEARLNGTPIFRLDLSKRKLKSVPTEILGWTELREVILDRNRIESIGPAWKQLALLERLSINSNQLEQFPAVLTQLDRLVTLEMGDNMIDSIPLDIDQMSALESLALWDNVLAYFPASLSDLPNLRKLDLLHNDMVIEEQEALRGWLSSEVELILSAPCRCDFDE
ncbi:leucine-rich repeat domain-containing protein [Flavobacteriales bacterium]|nr:leucine-rich repeat domain-containing protein [Flavobacteriales bacterium]